MTDKNKTKTVVEVPNERLKDLMALRDKEEHEWGHTPLVGFLNTLIDAARDNGPVLPICEPLALTSSDGDQRVVYLQEDGDVTIWRDGSIRVGSFDALFERLTPLHPSAESVSEDGRLLTLDMSPWPTSGAADWRKEAKILRKERPDAQAAASLCDAVADAMEERGWT